MKYHIALGVLTILPGLGCSDATTPLDNATQQDYPVPLAVGNNWTYHVNMYDTGGRVYFSSPTTEWIRGDTVVDGQVWYYQDPSGDFYANRPGGYYTYVDYEPESTRIQLTYKYPCQEGDVYSNWRVVRRDSLVVVPAGMYNCVLYSYYLKTRSSFSYRDVFVAPGLGKVKEIRYGLWVDHNPYHTERVIVWMVVELTGHQLF